MATRRKARKRPVRRHDLRRRLLLAGVVAAAALMIGRAFQLSVVEHGWWLKRAEQQHTNTMPVPAARGTIYDRDGVPLAASREVWMIAVAPYQVADTNLVVRKIAENTGLSSREARKYVTSGEKWRLLPGRYEESARLALEGLGGVYFEATDLRFYPHERLGSEVLGHVNAVGDVAGGVEQALDSLLAGHDGQAVVRIGPTGRKIPGTMVRSQEPEAGLDLVLTLDTELQEIASDALTQALAGTGAASGDMLITDPFTGEVLAAVSRKADGPSRTWTAVTSPYEPGSTIKPFTVASLLMEHKATLADSIFAENGSYSLHGRVIHDVHAFGWLTLREAFLESSNIVMAKVASRLTEGE
ncbi:MAG: penicillin-binding transpeptidase domain-containing protein, partial [Gemmatimonadota bacterium]